MRRSELNNALQALHHVFLFGFIKLLVCWLTFRPVPLTDSPEEVQYIESSIISRVKV
jgi:hypothetical protein